MSSLVSFSSHSVVDTSRSRSPLGVSSNSCEFSTMKLDCCLAIWAIIFFLRSAAALALFFLASSSSSSVSSLTSIFSSSP